jgi:hypothetical protein
MSRRRLFGQSRRSEVDIKLGLAETPGCVSAGSVVRTRAPCILAPPVSRMGALTDLTPKDLSLGAFRKTEGKAVRGDWSIA